MKSNQYIDLDLVDRPVPIFMIGDSHCLIYSDLVLRDRISKRLFLTRSRYCRGTSSSRFVDAQKNLHPPIAQALISENLLDEHFQPFHLSKSPGSKAIDIAAEKQWRDPILVFFAGDIDLRSIFLKELGEGCHDFELPFEASGLDGFEPVPNRQIIPSQLVLQLAEKLVLPLFQGLIGLAKMGFSNIYLHNLPPQTVDDDHYEKVNGYRCPAIIRYKATLFFNYLFRNYSAQSDIRFLDVYDDVTTEGRVDPAYELDGVHLNRRAALLTLEKVLIDRLNVPRFPNIDRYQDASRLAQDKVKSVIDSVDEQVRKRFEVDAIVTLDIGREQADILRTSLDFSLDVGNREARLDWAGGPIVPFSKHIRTAIPSTEVLQRIHDLVFEGPLAKAIRSCVGCEYTILNHRPFHSLVHSGQGAGPQAMHHDGCPPGVIRAIVYLTDVDDESGPFEYMLTDGGGARAVTGPAGTVFVFDANRLLHRARPPMTRERQAVDFVIAPLIPGRKRELVWAGMNNWPVDPFDFSTEGLLVYPSSV
ncbi:MAG: hypothetical protein QF752_10765 [Planctomycetota bacterium]|jgi:hypothetical protein|nr:hypothetical protein [Planctomycetota bacterium]